MTAVQRIFRAASIKKRLPREYARSMAVGGGGVGERETGSWRSVKEMGSEKAAWAPRSSDTAKY